MPPSQRQSDAERLALSPCQDIPARIIAHNVSAPL